MDIHRRSWTWAKKHSMQPPSEFIGRGLMPGVVRILMQPPFAADVALTHHVVLCSQHRTFARHNALACYCASPGSVASAVQLCFVYVW